MAYINTDTIVNSILNEVFSKRRKENIISTVRLNLYIIFVCERFKEKTGEELLDTHAWDRSGVIPTPWGFHSKMSCLDGTGVNVYWRIADGNAWMIDNKDVEIIASDVVTDYEKTSDIALINHYLSRHVREINP